MDNTTRQSLISAARRRAKAASRADGLSHQAHLERIAREAGREDWAAFLTDPVELAEEQAANISTSDQNDQDAPQNDYWRRVANARFPHVMLIQGLGAVFVAGLLLLAMNPGWIVVRMDYLSPDITRVLAIVTLVLFGLALIPLMPILAIAVTATLESFSRKRPKGVLPQIWRRTAAYAVTPIACITGLTFLPDIITSMPVEDVNGMYEDRIYLHPIAMTDSGKPHSVMVLEKSGNMRRIADIIDGRAIPRSVRTAGLSENPLPKTIKGKYVDNPVVRAVHELDCESGKIRFLSLELAQSVTGPAAATQVARKSTTPRRLNPVDQFTLCHAEIAKPAKTASARE